MQRWKNIRIRKRHRWLLIPLLIIVIGLAIARQYLDIMKGNDLSKDAFRKIRERGYLVALTDRNSMNYFIYRGEPMGFQLALLRSFADYLDVPLKVIVLDDISKLYYYLDMNVGDVLAFNLPLTSEGKRKVNFTETMGETRLVLVQRKAPVKNIYRPARLIRLPSDFESDTVYMQRNIFDKPVLAHFLRKAGRNMVLIEEPHKNSVELLHMVAQGKIDYAICDENLATILKRVFPVLDDEMILTGFYDYGWAVSNSSGSFGRNLNEWIISIKKNNELKQTYLTYFNNPAVPGYFSSDFFSLRGRKISPFDPMIRKLSKIINWDWRLLASLIYEESNFQLNVVSSRNATGLMQLMPQNADKYGMDSTSSPSQQLVAGVKLLKWIDNQVPAEIYDPKERINFILAAYNVGIGRVLTARDKALKYGKDPNKWTGNVGYYLTRRSIKNPTPADTGTDLSAYSSAGRFVENILERYQHYRNNIPE